MIHLKNGRDKEKKRVKERERCCSEGGVRVVGQAPDVMGVLGQAFNGVFGGPGLDRAVPPDDPVEHLVPEATRAAGLKGFLDCEVVRHH